MPSVVRSVRPDVVPVRAIAKRVKVVTLLGVALALMAAPQVAEAQGFIARANTSRTVWVEYGRGGPGSNGFESARVPVEYLVYACRGLTPGAVLVRYRLLADNVATSSAYWYEGKRYEATGKPNVRFARVSATATSPAGEVGSMQREASPATSMPADCESGGVNFSDLGSVSRFADPTKPAAVAQFLNTVTLSAESLSEPLRDNSMEQEFARQQRAEEQAAAERARVERERQAAETRAAAQAQAGQAGSGSTTGSTGGSASGDSAVATTMTPAQVEAAERARRQEEARRAVEQAEEDARRQREQQEEMAAAAGEVAGMAARTGGAFGGYYFSGGDASNSYNKFSEVTGMGFGFNFGPMIMDLGQLTGTYNEFFIEDYAEENAGQLPETGEVEGYFVHVGLQLQKTFDSLRMGVSGGYMHAITDDAEITTPTLGFILGYSMLKFRVDAGLGDEGTVGYAFYLQF